MVVVAVVVVEGGGEEGEEEVLLSANSKVYCRMSCSGHRLTPDP